MNEQNPRRFASLAAKASNLAAAATTGGAVENVVKADKSTLVTMLTGEVIKAAAVVDLPNVLVNILIGTARSPLLKYAVPFRALIGTARQPFVLPEPFELAAGQEAEVVLTNGENAAVTAYVVLIGSSPAN
jgi:hypothetical protein